MHNTYAWHSLFYRYYVLHNTYVWHTTVFVWCLYGKKQAQAKKPAPVFFVNTVFKRLNYFNTIHIRLISALTSVGK